MVIGIDHLATLLHTTVHVQRLRCHSATAKAQAVDAVSKFGIIYSVSSVRPVFSPRKGTLPFCGALPFRDAHECAAVVNKGHSSDYSSWAPSVRELGRCWRHARVSMGKPYWEAIAVRAKAGIGYHGVTSSIPPSDRPTSSVVGKGEVMVFIKH